MREIVISKNEAGQRLNKLLMKYLDKAPSSFVYRMIRKKNIKAIKLTLMNSKGEEHCCELSDASDEIKDSILDLIVKLRKQNDVQIKFVQGFEVKVTPNLIKGILIELK